MEFPECSFPTSVCPHWDEPDFKNRAFAEYRPFSQVDFRCLHKDNTDDTEMKCFPQKGLGRIYGLKDNLPPLPLYKESFSDGDSFRDPILGVDNYEDAIRSAKLIWENLVYNSIQPSTTKNCEKEIADSRVLIDRCLAEPANSHHLTSLRKTVPERVKNLFGNHVSISKATNENCMNGFNRDYYQGLLCSTQSSNSTLLYHAAGENFRYIYVTEVSEDDGCIPRGNKLAKVTLEKPVFQLTCSQQGVVCARQENECCVLMQSSTSQECILQKTQTLSLGKKLSHCEFSPYNKDELLVSSTKGRVSLWNFDSGSRMPFRKVSKSSSSTPWCSSHFAGHPRQIVVSDNFSMDMFDHRDSFGKGLELFHLSDRLVKNHESVMATASLGFPYHLVTTDFSLFVVDQRMPNSPVLQWSTQSVNNSLYIQAHNFSNLSKEEPAAGGGYDHFIFLGTQMPAQVLCYPLHVVNGCAPVTETFPWSVGKIGEFASHENTSYQPLLREVEKRFESSLAGMTVVSEPGQKKTSITVYQMDGYGDVYFQSFGLMAWLQPIGHYTAVAPTDEQKAEANDRATSFLSALDKKMVFDKRSQLTQSDEIQPQSTQSDDEESPPPPFSFSDFEAVLATGVEEISEGKLEDLSVSKIRQRARKFLNLNALSKVGSHTRLLLALKEDEDVEELLLERDQDSSKKKKELRVSYLRDKIKEKKKAKAVSKSEKTKSGAKANGKGKK